MPEICLLGTGGRLPLKDRFLTSLYAEYNGKALLIDCGEGTQVAMGLHGIKMSRINAILITHSHADHITGLPGLLLSIGNCSRTEPIDLFIPESTLNIITNVISMCGFLPYEVNIHTLPENAPTEFSLENIDPMLKISTILLSHSVACIGYKLTLYKKPVFSPEKAKSLNVPVQYWKSLHNGETVTLPDGKIISPHEVTAESRPPLIITYTTDTRPIDSMTEFAGNSDLFICEGMYGDVTHKESLDAKGHMLMQDACRIAKQANAKRLWLTHYSPAEKEPYIYNEELKEIFPCVTVSRDGEKISL